MRIEVYRMIFMHLPIAILEGKKIQRVIFSIDPPSPTLQNTYFLMEKVYQRGSWCFNLSTARHVESFQRLRERVEDETLIGFGHIEAGSGVSLMGKPIHQFESKVASTIARNIVPKDLMRRLFPNPPLGDVLTQKEIDRMRFDPSRFSQALSLYSSKEVPFLQIGGKYSDWLLGLGRVDLLREMVTETKRKNFIPIFSGQWATFVLPKAKSLDVAGYATPVNKRKSLFDLTLASDIIKKFDRPIISLDPLSKGRLLKKSEEALSFLFNELKIHSAIIEVASEDQIEVLWRVLEKIPSLIPFRKTG